YDFAVSLVQHRDPRDPVTAIERARLSVLGIIPAHRPCLAGDRPAHMTIGGTLHVPVKRAVVRSRDRSAGSPGARGSLSRQVTNPDCSTWRRVFLWLPSASKLGESDPDG